MLHYKLLGNYGYTCVQIFACILLLKNVASLAIIYRNFHSDMSTATARNSPKFLKEDDQDTVRKARSPVERP